MYHISFHQIYYFLTLAQTLSFTETSHMLYISQPTLSKQISALETELGMSLFKRTRRTVELTEEGKLLAKEWSVIQNLMNSSVYHAKLLTLQAFGKLRIGCADTFEIDDELAPVIREFHQEHPQIRCDLESHGFKSLRSLLNAGDLDIIFIPGFELPAYKHIEKLFFQHLELGIAVPSGHPLAKKEHVTVADLANEPIITLKESSFGESKVKSYFKKHGIEPHITRQVSNLNSLMLALKNGVGCTICHVRVKSPHIRIFSLDDQPNDGNIYAVWKEDFASAELELFKNLLMCKSGGEW